MPVSRCADDGGVVVVVVVVAVAGVGGGGGGGGVVGRQVAGEGEGGRLAPALAPRTQPT